MLDTPSKISNQELKERVLYSLMGAVVRLAEVFRFPMKDLTKWLEVAYFHQLKDRGLSQKEIAEFTGVSRRKVADLAAKLRKNFLRPEHEAGLPRRIEFVLWAGEQSEGRICQIMDAPEEEVKEALNRLVEEDRIVREEQNTTYYRRPHGQFRLYDNNWIRKIDALNNHLANIVDGIYAKFFTEDETAQARTVNFRVFEDDLEEIDTLYDHVIFPKLAELEHRTERQEDRDDEVVEMRLSVNWARYEYCKKFVQSESNPEKNYAN